jgi:hypothetical protein
VKLFNVIAINERTKTKTVLTNSPLNHGEAVTMKDKFTPHKHVRIQLEPATCPLAPEHDFGVVFCWNCGADTP